MYLYFVKKIANDTTVQQNKIKTLLEKCCREAFKNLFFTRNLLVKKFFETPQSVHKNIHGGQGGATH
jgi:hypothetical protein